jgi:cyclic beta-1,2-glucan synthetase
VVSPYSSFLALAVDPHEAVQNLQRLRDMGCLGELGFYDAVDFAPDRRDPAQGFKRIPCWMVHHQGMSLISACDLLTGGAIHKLFHSEPAVRATELLLDEKPPHTPPRVERSSNAAAGAELSLKGNGHDSRA